MEIGKRVKINGNIFNGKEGVIEEINDDKATVYVDFNVDEGKRVRQDYLLDELEEVFEESLLENAYKDVSLNANEFKDIEVFSMDSGRQPVFETFEIIENEKLRSKVLKDVERLSILRENLKYPYCLPLEDGIIELRTEQGNNQFRILYIFDGSKIILLNAYIKKQQKLDRSKLKLAKDYKKDYFERKGIK